MPLPTLVKTWQITRNTTVPALGTTLATSKRSMRTLKNVFIGFASNPWVVRGSSNAVTQGLDSVDRWAADADIVWGGGNHSWIVFRNTQLNNFEICLDLNNGFERSGSLVVSRSGAFSGGALNARPTAADEVILINNTDLHPESDVQRQFHAWHSSDGKATRVAMWINNANPIFWVIEEPRSPRTGWTNPNFYMLRMAFGGTFMDRGALYLSYAAGPARGTIGAVNAVFSLSGEAVSDGPLATLAPTATLQNEIDSTWDFYPIGFASNTGTVRGRHGLLHDMWWAPSSVGNGDTAPNNAADRQFVKMGSLWMPWDPGGSTVPLFV